MDIYEWLLDPVDPSVRYRTLVELLDKDSTDEAIQARNAITDSPPVNKLLKSMHPDGYWLENKKSWGIIGDGALYGMQGTPHHCLSHLAELGMDRTHPLVDKAASRYLSLQQEDGDWIYHASCLYSMNIRTFVKLGYREDDHVQRTIDMMLGTERFDGGYLCDPKLLKQKKQPKSCVRGSDKALLAFAELPEYWSHERCRQLVNYFLKRNGIYKNNDHSKFVCLDMERESFPINFGTNVWEVLYALSKMGYGKDERLKDAWDVLHSRRDSSGRYILGWTHGSCPWKVGKAGEPNKWVTLYCMLAEKYCG
jgi:hypothetical protein